MSEQNSQVITLNVRNSAEILAQYIEVAQKAGTFLLPESDVLKRAKDVLLNGVEDNEINIPTARNLFIQAVNKGQSKGAYTLDDASLIHKICQFLSQNLTTENPPLPSIPVSNVPDSIEQESIETDSTDLESLSDPVPLRSGLRTI